MSNNYKYSGEQKVAILQEYLEGKSTIEQVCMKYGIHPSTFDAWRHKYAFYGLEGLNKSSTLKDYPQELRLQAVKDCLEGRHSIRSAARKYGIMSHTILWHWIKQYNGHRELGRTRKARSPSMTKGRSTTWKERIEITEYCIAHNKDYQKAMDIYNVSYPQVYSWIRKYEDGGINALKDGRGRTKDASELTPQELQKLAMKKLEAENQRLRAEVAFLKKLEELERRRS
jgi:transposase-like protein